MFVDGLPLDNMVDLLKQKVHTQVEVSGTFHWHEGLRTGVLVLDLEVVEGHFLEVQNQVEACSQEVAAYSDLALEDIPKEQDLLPFGSVPSFPCPLSSSPPLSFPPF